MRKLFKKLHLWLGIPAGIIITIICLTGSILSFETEILETIYPERYFVKETSSEKIPLNELVPIINQQLQDNTVASIKVSSNSNRTYTATLKEGFRISAFVNPYTGKVIYIKQFQEGFFYNMMVLHRWLMDGTRTWGKYTVGISTLIFVVIIITGIVWWAPAKRKQVKKQLKHRLKIKTRSGVKRFLHDAHSVIGMYASIFLLVCCLTGLMWSFDWYRDTVYKVFGAETTKSKKHGGNDNKKKKNDLDITHWNDVLINVQNKIPDFQYITIAEGNATVLTNSAPHSRATDKYSFDKTTGKITDTNYYSQQPLSQTLMTWAYALHVGSFGGITMRILICLASFIGATLPLTGYYIFWRKRHKKKHQKI